MPLTKRTYALPKQVVQELEDAVESGRRSAVVSEAVREWLDSKRRERIRREVIQGCEDMADVYLKIEREYHALEEEVERGTHDQSAARRRRARSARSR